MASTAGAMAWLAGARALKADAATALQRLFRRSSQRLD